MDDYLKSLDEDYRRRRAIQRELDKIKDDTVIDENGNELIFEKHESDLRKPKALGVCSLDNMKVDISRELEWLEMKAEKKEEKKDSLWISTKDQLPETMNVVLIRLKDGRYTTGNYWYLFGLPIGPKCWFSMDTLKTYTNDDVTHWMEIPEVL